MFIFNKLVSTKVPDLSRMICIIRLEIFFNYLRICARSQLLEVFVQGQLKLVFQILIAVKSVDWLVGRVDREGGEPK